MSERDEKQNEELTAEDLGQAAGGDELTAEDLDQAAGGSVDTFLKIGGLKGE